MGDSRFALRDMLVAPAEPVMERKVVQAVVPVSKHECFVKKKATRQEFADQKENADQDEERGTGPPGFRSVYPCPLAGDRSVALSFAGQQSAGGKE